MAEKKWEFNAPRLWGTSNTWTVLNEDTGKVGGTQTEHWDDSLDANVFLQPIRFQLFPRLGPNASQDAVIEDVLEQLRDAGVVP